MSQVETELAHKAQQLPPGSFRQTVLVAAKRFKASWVELGKLLVKVRDDKLYEEWGFEDFETYCAKEIHIRKQTAWKLVRNFSFLAKHEPKAMAQQDAAEHAPAFEVVEVLAEAEERGQLTAAEYRDVRNAIWEPQGPTSELRRELVDRFPRPEPKVSDTTQIRRLASSAKRLAAELAHCRRVPKAVAERAAALAEDVEELIRAGADA